MDANALNARDEMISDVRKAWETPRIVLERSLEVSAQGGPQAAHRTALSGR